MPSPTSVVAYIGTEKITREELGEFLIQRFGAEKLELMINRKIIDAACAEKNVLVTDHEVDTTMDAELKQMKMDRKVFEKEMLARWGKTLLEWREDVVRPKLMLGRLSEGRVTVTPEDLKKGFDAYYGERLECRMVLYPRDQAGLRADTRRCETANWSSTGRPGSRRRRAWRRSTADCRCSAATRWATTTWSGRRSGCSRAR